MEIEKIYRDHYKVEFSLSQLESLSHYIPKHEFDDSKLNKRRKESEREEESKGERR